MKTTKQNNTSLKNTHTKKNNILKESVEPTFSVDTVIDAYQTGHHDGCGFKANIIEVASDLVNRLKNSLDSINDFYAKNLDNNICLASFFKFENRQKISFLFAIKDEYYYDSNVRKKLYDNSGQSMLRNSYIDISFMPCKDKSCINEDGIFSDDFKELPPNAG